jgi:hypothetical protein
VSRATTPLALSRFRPATALPPQEPVVPGSYGTHMASSERGYEIAYQEALRAINDQQAAIDSIQARVGFVASAGALVLSLSAQRTLESAVTPALGLAVGSFICLALLSVFILWPRRKWRFHFGTERLHAEYVEHAQPLSAGLMMRDLSLHLDRYFQADSRIIDRLS